MSDSSARGPEEEEARHAEPDADPDEAVGDFGQGHQSDEGGDSDVDLTSDG